MSKENLTKLLLAYMQGQAEELCRGFPWDNPERGGMVPWVTKSVWAGRRTGRWSDWRMISDNGGGTRKPNEQQVVSPGRDSAETYAQVKLEERSVDNA